MIDAIRRHIHDFHRSCSPGPRVTDLLDWICACRTQALGGHQQRCACGWSEPRYNSCTQNNCPQCRAGARAKWLDKRDAHLLPVPHFQVVFTIPEPLRQLALDNPRLVYDAMISSAAETLKTLAKQRLDASPGIVAVLHTWNRDLNFHPHVHCIVTAGGLSQGGDWIETRPDYLFPQRVMAAMFRGKVMEALRDAHADGSLRVRGESPARTFETQRAAAYRHRWVVHVEPPNGRPPDHVAKYLARYVYGGPISDRRLLAITDSTVTFEGIRGPVTVVGHEFIRRFSLHFLPHRFMRARYYGLYSNTSRNTRLVEARSVLGAPQPAPVQQAPYEPRCPRCGRPVEVWGIPGIPYARPNQPPSARGPP